MYHYKIEKKRKKTNKRVIIWIISLFLLAGLAYVLFLSPVFKVKAADISGNKEINHDEIKNSVINKNIILTSDQKLKQELMEKFPKISEMKIGKNIFKGLLKINITEREEVGIICKENPAFAKATTGTCFYVDKNGVVFDNAPQTSGSLILLIKDYSQRNLQLGDGAVSGKFMSFVLEIDDNLLNTLGLKVLDFEISSFPIQNLKAMTRDGWYVVFNPENNIKNQLLILKTVLDDNIKNRNTLQYIDLTIENRVYYR